MNSLINYSNKSFKRYFVISLIFEIDKTNHKIFISSTSKTISTKKLIKKL
jgi:hypothetical protein